MQTDYPTHCFGCSIPIPPPPTPVAVLGDYLCHVCIAMAESCSTPYWQEIRRAQTREYFAWVHRKLVLMGAIDE
jgi:hypothetical protein